MDSRDPALYKRGKATYVRVPLGNGRYQHVSLGKVSRREALEKAERILTSTTRDILFDDAAQRFLREYAAILSAGTFRVYRSALISASRHLEGRRCFDIGAAHLSAWEAEMRSQGKAQSTISGYFGAVSSLYEWVGSLGIEAGNPVKPYIKRSAKRPDRLSIAPSPPRTRWLSEDEEARLLGAIDAKIKEALAAGHRRTAHHRKILRAAVVLAIDLGLRKSELFGLRWGDIKGSHVVVRAETAKGGRRREVPLLPRAQTELSRVANADKGGLVLPHRRGTGHGGQMHVLTAAVAWAGLPHTTWHDLRRTCGCRLLQGGLTTEGRVMDMDGVAKWLGHSNASITARHYAFLDHDSLVRRFNAARWLDGTKGVV